MKAPLEGIRVLDFSRMLPGPFCSMLLGDFGAEVTKIESPLLKDFVDDSELWKAVRTVSVMTDRNKKSMTLNLKSEEGKQIFHKMAQTADVLLEGFRPGVMERLGLSYEIVNKINPGIIYCSISSYGQDGPCRTKPGHDVNFLGTSGILDITGKANEIPAMPGIPIGDIGGGGMVAAIAILLALLWREKTGRGQYIDISMLDGLISFMLPIFARYLYENDTSPRGESLMTGGYAAYNVYETLDGKYISLGNSEPQHWANFCKEIRREDLIEHQYTRGEKGKEIYSFLCDLFKTKARNEWIRDLEDKDICISAVNTIDEVLSDPQIQQRRLLEEIYHPASRRKIQILRAPMKMSETPGQIKTPAPEIGQHTKEILASLGYAEAEILRLHEEKIV